MACSTFMRQEAAALFLKLIGSKVSGTRGQCTSSCGSPTWDHYTASTCLNSSLISSLWGSNKSKMRSHLAANQPQTSMKL